MNKKQKATFMTLALVPAAVVAVGDIHVKATENDDSLKTISGSWVNPHHIYDAKPLKQRMASVGRVALAEISESKVTSIEELKTAVYENYRSFNTDFIINYKGDTSGIFDTLDKILDDVHTDQTMVYEAGTLSRTFYKSSYNATEAVFTFTVDYYTTAAQEQFVDSEVVRITNEIIDSKMTTFEKVKAINDYIVLNTTYSTESVASPHAAYAILKEGEGVCQAYALLAYRLLREAGIDAYYVTGIANNGPHAWNLVKMDDGNWYHLDTTWNDPVHSDSTEDMSGFVRYKYFLVSDTVLQKDHTIDAKGYPIANSEKYTSLHGVVTPIIVGSEWYYTNSSDSNKLYKVDSTDVEVGTKKVTDLAMRYLIQHDGWLYFSNYSYGGYLFKIS